MDVISDINSIITRIKSNYSVNRIGVFGSYSRGEYGSVSDIDILVEFKEISFDNYMGLLHFLEDRYGKKIDLVTVQALNKRLRPQILKEVKWCET